MHQLDRVIDRLFGMYGHRIIDLDLRHFNTRILQEHGYLKAESVQKVFRLRPDLAKPAGYCLYPIGALEKSIADRGRDRIRVRMLVSCDIDNILFHIALL